MRCFTVLCTIPAQGFLRGPYDRDPFYHRHYMVALDSDYRRKSTDSETTQLKAVVFTDLKVIDEQLLLEALDAAFDAWELPHVLEASVCKDLGIEKGARSVNGSLSLRMPSRLSRELAANFAAEELVWILCEPNVASESPIVDRDGLTFFQDVAESAGYDCALADELKRMRAKTCPPSPLCHQFIPAHYVIEASNDREARAVVAVLGSALADAGRVPSGSQLTLNLDNIGALTDFKHDNCRSHYMSNLNEGLLASLDGMLLVVRYGKFDKDGSYDLAAYQAFQKLVKALANKPHSVQTVFVLPEKNPDLLDRLRNDLKAPLVELARKYAPLASALNREELMAQIKPLLAKEGLASDESLDRLVDEVLGCKEPITPQEVFERWRRQKLTRELYPAYEKLVSPTEVRAQTAKAATERLDELVGLKEVKKHLKEVVASIALDGVRQRREAVIGGKPSMHLAFMGAPGTGKTEVARLYAQILKEQGILLEGRCIEIAGPEVNASNINELFEKARGSVLFIDEAYGLGLMRVTSLIACMENYREDVVVILAGYKDAMERLLDSNTGFRSRLAATIDFPDYSAQELLDIFCLMARNSGVKLGENTLERLQDLFARGGKRDDEGNARFVRKVFEESVRRQNNRLAQQGNLEELGQEELLTLLPSDVPGFDKEEQGGQSAQESLDELVGLDEVKASIADYLDFLTVQKMRRDAGYGNKTLPMHLAFTGNPGTGKTEVARLVAKILKERGVLSVGDLYETTGTALVSAFVGGTAINVRNLFAKAKGSVVFIDEAYGMVCPMGRGEIHDDAVTEIIAQMENLREDVVTIFAGYPQEIDELLDVNSGFRSRVGTIIDFPDYSVSELREILHLMARQEGYRLADGVDEKVGRLLEKAFKDERFGNGRYVRNLFERALLAQSSRLMRKVRSTGESCSDDELLCLSAEDFCELECGSEPSRQPVGFLS